MAYETHELLATRLLEDFLAPALPFRAPVSVHQLQLADKKIFEILATRAQRGIRAVGAERPCNDELPRVLASMQVVALLQRLPAEVARGQVPAPSELKRPGDPIDQLLSRSTRKRKNKRGGGAGAAAANPCLCLHSCS